MCRSKYEISQISGSAPVTVTEGLLEDFIDLGVKTAAGLEV